MYFICDYNCINFCDDIFDNKKMLVKNRVKNVRSVIFLVWYFERSKCFKELFLKKIMMFNIKWWVCWKFVYMY